MESRSTFITLTLTLPISLHSPLAFVKSTAAYLCQKTVFSCNKSEQPVCTDPPLNNAVDLLPTPHNKNTLIHMTAILQGLCFVIQSSLQVSKGARIGAKKRDAHFYLHRLLKHDTLITQRSFEQYKNLPKMLLVVFLSPSCTKHRRNFTTHRPPSKIQCKPYNF